MSWIKRFLTFGSGLLRKRNVSYGGYCMKGLRASMEDRNFLIPCLSSFSRDNAIPKQIQLFGVFDGHGGSITSSYAKENFPHLLVNQMRGTFSQSNKPNVDQITNSLRQAIYDTHNKLLEDNPDKFPMDGSTAVISMLYNNKIFTVNVGDSRAILSRNKEAYALTEDHSPLNKKEAERIKEDGGAIVQSSIYDCHRVYFNDGSGGLAMTRALGDEFYNKEGIDLVPAEPDITVVDIDHATDDFLLLVSDGVLETKSSQDLVDEVHSWLKKEKISINIVCRELLYSAINSGSNDNVTAIIVQFDNKKS